MFPALFIAALFAGTSLRAQKQFVEFAKQLLPKDANDATWSMAFGDVDGDGDLDLVLGNTGQLSRLYVNNGKGTFTDVTAVRMPKINVHTNDVILGDVDGDGDLDLLLANSNPFLARQNWLFLNDGKGTFTDATASHLPKLIDMSNCLALGDVDGDGDLDLFTGDGSPFVGQHQNRLYLNDGKGKFTDATSRNLPKDSDVTRDVVLSDVDRDGDLDLVLANTGQNRLYLNDGKGRFTDATALRMPKLSDDSWGLAIGDVDGDGDLDLVFGNDKLNSLFLNSGKGTFTNATVSRLPNHSDATVDVALGDVDGDGDLDLLVANISRFSKQPNRFYLNDGKGRFSESSGRWLPNLDDSLEVLLGDVDGDGDLDLVFGNNFQQNRLFRNLHRQADAPLVARIGKTYPLDFYAKPGYARSYHLVVPFVATAERQTSFGQFGTLGLDLSRTVVLPLMVILPFTGKTTLALAVPNVPSLAGVSIFSQAVIISDLLFARPGWRFTNVTADKILR